MPGEMESFGLAALEGMSSGVDGYLCDVGAVETMSAQAVGLLGDLNKCREMGQAARRTAIERFPTELIIPKYEAMYRRVAEER